MAACPPREHPPPRLVGMWRLLQQLQVESSGMGTAVLPPMHAAA
jgi:hypothetical protein